MASIGKLWTSGYVVRVDLPAQAGARTVKPPPNKGWMIIGGCVNHVTGTATVVLICDTSTVNDHEILIQIPAASASNLYPIFLGLQSNNVDFSAAWTMNIVMGDEKVYFAGDAAAFGYLKCIEFDLK